MAALARWCVQRRLVTVLLWLLALAGIAAGAFVAGSAYSNDYKVPGTESGHAAELMKEGFPSLGGDSDSVVWHTASGTVRDSGVEQTMTRTLDRLEELPGVASVSGPYDDGGAGRISAAGRTAYATVTFEHSGKDITSGEAEAVVKTAKSATVITWPSSTMPA